MTFRYLPFWVILCTFVYSYSQETSVPPFGKGLVNLIGKDSTWSMKFAARMQFLGIAEWDKADEGGLVDPESNMLIRRARLKFGGFALSPALTYKLELGLSNRDIDGVSQFTGNAPRYILDAVVMWNFYENFELWVGQTKLPGNIERVISSGDLQQVDRSLLNSRFNIDRDVGLQLRHHMYISKNVLLREKFAFSQGEGRNITTGNLGGHQYTMRLEVLPLGRFSGDDEYSGGDLKREEKPRLMVAATYDSNKDAVKTRSNLGGYMVNDGGFHHTDINTLFVDAIFKYSGFSLMAEYANRSADEPVALNSDGSPTGDVVLTGHALNVQSGYLFETNWEVSGRYTFNNFDQVTGRGSESQYTLGVSRYIVGHKLKVQTDLSYLESDAGSDEFMYRLQLDIHF
jgi:hypothetical protein